MLPTAPVIFVVDDDLSVREALELLICTAGWQPKLFASAREFLDYRRDPGPACLILDVGLPDLNGLELQQRLASDSGEMPIIFITGYGDVPTTVRAMKAGAAEFLTKPFDDDILLRAVESALERSTEAVAKASELAQVRRAYDSLSRREREVMARVVAGLMNKQVAFELGISEITVKAHRGQVMRKMKAPSFAELVNMAARLRTAALPVPTAKE
jgi:FixJ family two-component response regulator